MSFMLFRHFYLIPLISVGLDCWAGDISSVEKWAGFSDLIVKGRFLFEKAQIVGQARYKEMQHLNIKDFQYSELYLDRSSLI